MQLWILDALLGAYQHTSVAARLPCADCSHWGIDSHYYCYYWSVPCLSNQFECGSLYQDGGSKADKSRSLCSQQHPRQVIIIVCAHVVRIHIVCYGINDRCQCAIADHRSAPLGGHLNRTRSCVRCAATLQRKLDYYFM